MTANIVPPTCLCGAPATVYADDAGTTAICARCWCDQHADELEEASA